MPGADAPLIVKFTTVLDHALVSPVPTVSVTLARASYDPLGRLSDRLIWLAAFSPAVIVWTVSETRGDHDPPVTCTCSSTLSPAPIELSTSMVKTAVVVADTRLSTGVVGTAIAAAVACTVRMFVPAARLLAPDKVTVILPALSIA